MKIGIDAKWYFNGPVSGRIFIQNVLKELIALRHDIEWHIFLNAGNKENEFPFVADNIKVHFARARFNLISNLFVIPKLAKQLKLDAVFFQTFSPKENSFKSVVFIHDVLFKNYPQFFTWKEKLYFQPLKWTIRNADRIATTTNFVRHQLIQFNYTKRNQPVDLAPSGVTSIFRPLNSHDQDFVLRVKNKFDLPTDYLLVVGRLNARKNVETLIRSLPLINDKEIQLVIVGEENWKAPNLKSIEKNKQLTSRIKFTGFVTDEELSAIYAMARIFCFPSFAEGFGLPPLEAMASGIPVAVSNTTSMPEVCDKAAIYFDPNRAEEIAVSINSLLENKSLYEQKRNEGLEWSKNYTWKRTAEGILQSIISAIQTPS